MEQQLAQQQQWAEARAEAQQQWVAQRVEAAQQAEAGPDSQLAAEDWRAQSRCGVAAPLRLPAACARQHPIRLGDFSVCSRPLVVCWF